MDAVQMLGARIGQLEIDKAVLYAQNIALQKELEELKNGNSTTTKEQRGSAEVSE